MGFIPEDWGCYPKEYNREIHGPYNPSVYYGKRDTPIGDVKLGELSAWFSRRNKSPRAILAAISRGFYRYRLTWMDVKTPTGAFFYQIMAANCLLWFYLDYNTIKKERKYRYH